MRKLYNTFSNISTNFKDFFNNVCNLSKPQINFISNCLTGMIKAESVVTTDIIKKIPLKEGISYIHNLFANKNYNLIFLADRWFNFCDIMHHIDSLGHIYCIRTKSNISIHINNFDYPDMIQSIADIEPHLTKSKYFDDVFITSNNFKTKLAVSKIDSHNEPFFILTNGNTRDAIKFYGYRFGSIEFIFKNHKSNGFYLEATRH